MKSCPFCNKSFAATHGNQKYCSIICSKSQKAATQQRLYSIVSEFRKGFLTNYKLFEQLLPDKGEKIYPLNELISKGFNHNCYYKAFIDEQKNNWYEVQQL